MSIGVKMKITFSVETGIALANFMPYGEIQVPGFFYKIYWWISFEIF